MARKYFTLPFITIRGRGDTPPPKSADGQARLYFDEATGSLLISKNGAEWEALGVGSPGEPGPPGEPSFVAIQDDGYVVVSTPDTLNFVGATVTDAGGGVATVTINPPTAAETQLTVAINSNSFYTGYTLAGGTQIDADAWDTISWATTGAVSRSGITLEVVLRNTTADTVLATHTYTALSSSSDSTTLSLSGTVSVEVWHRLSGTLIDGDVGTLLSGIFILQRG